MTHMQTILGMSVAQGKCSEGTGTVVCSAKEVLNQVFIDLAQDPIESLQTML